MQLSDPKHFITGRDMLRDYPDGFEHFTAGMGCFWGVERIFWKLDGVWVTSVGYAGGQTDDPDYKSICTGTTGHAEVVHVVFDPAVISYDELLKVMFENHDPTQGNRQGNDVGTQYRSVIFYYNDAQKAKAQAAKALYENAYREKGYGPVTTQIVPAGDYWYAEDYHQQYLAKNPGGYCNHGPTGVSCPVPTKISL